MSRDRDTAAAIVREAKALIDERGEAALRVTEIAERCGVSPSVLYHHFRDREDIISAVREAEFVARIEADAKVIGGLAVSTDNAAEIMSLIVDDMSDPRNEERRRYRHERMQALVAARLDPALQSRLVAAQEQLSSVIIGAITDAQTAGLLDPALDPTAIAFLFEAIPLGTALATVYGDQLPSEQAWTDLLTRVVTALMPPG
ncbi:MAG: TetR/AcrR family transcriptional regulator [Actinomycetes bacterium]|jgi:AcrR family transcriptional regulator